MQDKETMQHVHQWTDQGLGEGPFRLVDVISFPSKSILEANPMAYNSQVAELHRQAGGYGLDGLCCCHSCGMGLQHNYIIQNAAGNHFVVGSSCVAKTGDAKLVTKVEAMERKRQQELRRARAEAKRAEREAKLEMELQAQRDRNGGLTDLELEDQQRQEAREAKRAQFTNDNHWLITVLENTRGGFAADMADNLCKGPWSRQEFSPRMIDIICDIYGKAHGRRNSKAYNAAREECENRLQD